MKPVLTRQTRAQTSSNKCNFRDPDLYAEEEQVKLGHTVRRTYNQSSDCSKVLAIITSIRVLSLGLATLERTVMPRTTLGASWADDDPSLPLPASKSSPPDGVSLQHNFHSCRCQCFLATSATAKQKPQYLDGGEDFRSSGLCRYAGARPERFR